MNSRVAITLVLASYLPVAAQTVAPPSEGAAPKVERTGKDASAPEGTKEGKVSVEDAVAAAVRVILSKQEGEEGRKEEWPYEGVYRVGGKIPIGYRIGGTGICALALMRAPGFGEHEEARAAVIRAAGFVARGPEFPLMSWEQYDAGYDVRGWGYTYGLMFLLKAKEAGLIAEEKRETAEGAIRFYLTAIHKTEIPEVGGWNYARPPGKEKVAPPSPFMTAPTLQALFEAKKAGYEVDAAVVGRGLEALEAGRAPSGSVVYAGKGDGRRDGVPGAVGRMLASECVLHLAGRGSPAGVRAALDAFIVHWDWLEKRRAKPGTHAAPYGVAPYYFYFAHYYAAVAAELLPEHERAEYRRRVDELVFRTRAEDGSWNDRVFPRSAAYGSAMAAMSLLMPGSERPAGWGKE